MSKPHEWTWSDYAAIYSAQLDILRAAGNLTLPTSAEVCAATDEARADAWCRRYAANLALDELPAEDLRGRIAARLLCAANVARHLAAKGDTPPPWTPQKMTDQLLIREWHSDLKALFRRVRPDDRGFSV